jgi:hypothetical protein
MKKTFHLHLQYSVLLRGGLGFYNKSVNNSVPEIQSVGITTPGSIACMV